MTVYRRVYRPSSREGQVSAPRDHAEVIPGQNSMCTHRDDTIACANVKLSREEDYDPDSDICGGFDV